MKENQSQLKLNEILRGIVIAVDNQGAEIQRKIIRLISLNQKQELKKYLTKCFGQIRANRYFEKLRIFMVEQTLNNVLQEIKYKYKLQAQQLVLIYKQIQTNNLERLKKVLAQLIDEKKSIHYSNIFQKFMKIQSEAIRMIPTLEYILNQLKQTEEIEEDQINQLKQIIQSKKSQKKVNESLVSILGNNKKKLQKYFGLLKPFINPQIRKPIQGAVKIRQINHLKIYLYPAPQKLPPDEEALSVNLIVLGQTGSGKTTIINSLINYVMKVDLQDNFRYEIINSTIRQDQSMSQTSQITVYNIKKHGEFPPIKIIDTPGFGDTRGIEMDQKVVQKISDLFNSKILTIDAICFVAKATNTRLTRNQKYIFNRALELFGKDIAENFLFLLTFCDGNQPKILNALQSKEGFGEIIPKIKQPWFLNFNNSAIFQSTNSGIGIETFWNLVMHSFSQFIIKIKTLNKKNLILTTQVLDQRKWLKKNVSVLQRKMNELLNLMDKIKQQLSIIQKYKNQINFCKDFNYQIQEIRIRLPIQNKYATLHKQNNKNTSNQVEYYMVKVKKTNKELFDKYCDINSKKGKQEQIIDGLVNQYSIIQIQCLNIQQNIKNTLHRLNKIALKANTMQNSMQYIDQIIQSEQKDQKIGYGSRIYQLKQLRNQYKLINDLYKNQNQEIKDINTFKQQFIQQKRKKLVENSTEEFFQKIKNQIY